MMLPSEKLHHYGEATPNGANGRGSRRRSPPVPHSRRLAFRYCVVVVLLAMDNVSAERMQTRGWKSSKLQTVGAKEHLLPGSIIPSNVTPSPFLLAVLRGGSEGALSDNEKSIGEEADNKDGAPVDTNAPPATEKDRRSWFRLFQLRNEVHYDASRAPYVKAKTSVPKNPTDSRGGAVVKQKPAPRFAWMSSFTNGNNRPAATAATPTARIASVRKVWWVNTWTDQLPSEEDERKEIEMQKATRTAVAANVTSTSSTLDDDGACEKSELESSDDSEEPMSKTEHPSIVVATKKKEPKHRRRGGRRNKPTEKKPKESPVQTIQEPTKPQVSTTEDESASLVPVDSVAKVQYPLLIPLPGGVGSPSKYCTAGSWSVIDQLCSIGLAQAHPQLRVSSHLRPLRKLAARVTGWHGLVSGKPTKALVSAGRLEQVRRRKDAIAKATFELAPPFSLRDPQQQRSRPHNKRNRPDYTFVLQKTLQDEFDESARLKRVKQIGEEMKEAGERMAQLACEKDVLQRRHNPLWKYAAEETTTSKEPADATVSDVTTTRFFNFPSDDLVMEYLDVLFASGRLIRLNHTDLWRNANNEEQDEFDDDFLGPMIPTEEKRRADDHGASSSSSGGSWLLRNGLGEKIGVTTERAAYKAVCKALMSVLARSLSSLHGISVMTHSDIRLTMEQTPSLPPLHIPGSEGYRNYAQDTIKDIMRRGARTNRYRRPRDDFIQRAAVVETLLSQCQIAAPIMKLFPLAWQRAMLGNIVSMVTALISDFCEGIEFQILGHRLSIAFTPITEEDMIQAMHSSASSSHNNPQPEDTERFEAAVRATAEDVAEGLQFLDRWHERALGGGMLRTQIATLIARLVLTLVDDILVASKMDLWATQAGGPRLVAGLEYRSVPQQQPRSPTGEQ